MPVERQDQKPNEVENMPAAYRTLTTTELEKLKQALSDRNEWKSKEREKTSREIEALFALWESRARYRTNRQICQMQQALSEMQGWKRDVGMMKRKWFVMGALAVLIPIFLYQFYWMIRCSPHW
jgi:hypothetical protein